MMERSNCCGAAVIREARYYTLGEIEALEQYIPLRYIPGSTKSQLRCSQCYRCCEVKTEEKKDDG